MARLIYAVTALAFAALVSGFFINSSSLPLIVSIALSAVVMVLILFGWSRKVRRNIDALLDPDQQEPAVDVVEVEEEELDDGVPRPTKPTAAGKRTPRRRPRELVETALLDTATIAITGPPTKKPAPKKPAAKKPAAKKPAAKKKPAVKKKPAAARGARVVVIPGGSRFHRKSCRFAKRDAAREVSEAIARKRGYEPCSTCF